MIGPDVVGAVAVYIRLFPGSRVNDDEFSEFPEIDVIVRLFDGVGDEVDIPLNAIVIGPVIAHLVIQCVDLFRHVSVENELTVRGFQVIRLHPVHDGIEMIHVVIGVHGSVAGCGGDVVDLELDSDAEKTELAS